MLPSIDELKSESDVEQKLIWPLLTGPYPSGLGLTPADITTKVSIRHLNIGKGTAGKLYFPDYVVVIAGLPVLVIEAKAPDESVNRGLDEARLYANELNALFPTSVNPCFRVISCNGSRLLSCPVDSSTADIQLDYADLTAANQGFASLLDACGRNALQRRTDNVRRRFRKSEYVRPVSLLGGETVQDEELPQNTFGATLAGDYGHIFNPKTREQRSFVATHAYVPSLRRQRYVEPIDRLIRNAVAPGTRSIPIIEDSSRPREIAKVLRDRSNLENQVLLLVGSVGAGKSTFVDYLSLAGLPEDIRSQTIWARLNLNEAPLAIDMAYSWVARGMVSELRRQSPGVEFDDIAVLERVFATELKAFRRGPLALLDADSIEYRTRLADRMSTLQSDSLGLAKAIARYLCSGPGRLLVIVLDNCDKRSRDEQLLMFQVAQWVQNEFRCLVVLPIRDVTYDLHRGEPPLDTALKQFVFRIEPPLFSEVLQARVRLALAEMTGTANAGTLSYQLPNGMKVTYPASDQAVYLVSIMRSLWAHDRFVRQVLGGLAGRDVRRALEIFLEFCTSGHIGEDEIYKIRFHRGDYELPLSIVARVLLRSQRRHYNGDKSYVKNIVQCVITDSLPDHFVRLAILHWLQGRLQRKGPAGVEGFHRVGELVRDLARLGHDANRVREELLYLLREKCVVAEHQRADSVKDEELVVITAAGTVHLQLMANPDYLNACAEDTYVSDRGLAERVAERMRRGTTVQFARSTTARTASEFVDYLKARAQEGLSRPEAYLTMETMEELRVLAEAEAGIRAAEIEVSTRIYVRGVPPEASEEDVRRAFEAAGFIPNAIVIPREEGGSGRGRGYAFVEMRDRRTAMGVLDAENKLRMNGKQLRVAEALSERSARGRSRYEAVSVSERVYIGNVPPGLTEAVFRDALRGYGLSVSEVDIPRGGKEYAFVRMRSLEEAKRALELLDGQTFLGRRVIVRPARPRRGAGRR